MKIKRSLHTVLAAALIVVPVASTVVYAAAVKQKSETAVITQAGKVSLNKADAKALMSVKGMSAYKAHAIIAYRNKNGDFKTTDDLTKVKGFKKMTPESMKGMTDQLLLD